MSEKASLPKGMRDFGPAQMAKRNFIIGHIRHVFQLFGFQPLETPAMENLETLTGKYGEEGDQLLFKILNSGDFLKAADVQAWEARNAKQLTPSISEKGLRYDLTVPFARYVVMNRHDIPMPFRRYQIQPVWRADRPQKGRYREFYQCDADVVGTDSLLCEAEIILMITEVFARLGINDYTIKINHRGILSGVAELANGSHEMALFVAIDKLDKVGEEKVREELRNKGFDEAGLDVVFSLLNQPGSASEKINFLTEKFANSPRGQKGTAEVQTVLQLLHNFGGSSKNVELDVSLARGLSYYTGCIFEVKINNVAIGSVSGGGRYDNLTQAFGAKEKLSGVGISFGIDRLYDAMDELKLFSEASAQSTKVLICWFDETSRNFSLRVVQQLRSNGIAAEIYPDAVKIQKQLDYANKKNMPFVVLIGSDEVASASVTLKNMQTGQQQKVGVEQLAAKIR